ncbi:MAG: hypothetical protein SWK76_16170 [Actinomycetota bacterium]|nr:hypothetical protein [Actinomycetota bacterium]
MRFIIRRGRGEEGFSLAELLISVIILAALVFAVFQVLNANLDAGRMFTAKAELAQELRSTLDTMVTQIRAANSFSDAQGSEVTFRGYLTGGTVMQTARFYLSGGDLYFTCADLGIDQSLLAKNVATLNMSYYDTTGTLIGDPNDNLETIAEVRIELTIDAIAQDIDETAITTVKVRK